MITKTDYLKHGIYDKDKRINKIDKEIALLLVKRDNYIIEIKELRKIIKKEVRKNG